MIIEDKNKYCVKFSMDSSNGDLAGRWISRTNKIVYDLLNGIEPAKEPDIVEQVIEPIIEVPKKRTRKKVLKDAPRD